MAKTPKNRAKPVHQGLFDGVRDRGEKFNGVSTRYAIERLLFRLSQLIRLLPHLKPLSHLKHWPTMDIETSKLSIVLPFIQQNG